MFRINYLRHTRLSRKRNREYPKPNLYISKKRGCRKAPFLSTLNDQRIQRLLQINIVFKSKLHTFAVQLKVYKMKSAEIHTAKGVMKVKFYEEDAPKTVANFVKLAKEGFYDGLAFHRVIPNFVIQGGCPFSKDMSNPRIGSGGPGYKIDCELTGNNQYHDRGVLSMAHAGRNTGGSQFFVCHGRQNTQHLDRQHTCFGKVYEGLEVIDAIVAGDKIEKIVIIES